MTHLVIETLWQHSMFYTQGRCGSTGHYRLSRKICYRSTTVSHNVTSCYWLLWTRSVIRNNAWQLTKNLNQICTIQLCICGHICNTFRPDLLSIFTESIYAAAWDSLSTVNQLVLIPCDYNVVARKIYSIKGAWQLFVHGNIYALFFYSAHNLYIEVLTFHKRDVWYVRVYTDRRTVKEKTTWETST
jgi:hypothetical protein